MLICFLAWRWSVRVLVARQHRLEALVRERTEELEKEKAELLKTRAALVEQATRDSLTGLLNRAEIMHQLDLEMERARRTGSSLAFVLLDIDYFKQVNDSLGHFAGDDVLRRIALVLRDGTRHRASMDDLEPASEQAVAQRFAAAARPVVGVSRSERIADGVAALESLDDVGALMRLTETDAANSRDG